MAERREAVAAAVRSIARDGVPGVEVWEATERLWGLLHAALVAHLDREGSARREAEEGDRRAVVASEREAAGLPPVTYETRGRPAKGEARKPPPATDRERLRAWAEAIRGDWRCDPVTRPRVGRDWWRSIESEHGSPIPVEVRSQVAADRLADAVGAVLGAFSRRPPAAAVTVIEVAVREVYEALSGQTAGMGHYQSGPKSGEPVGPFHRFRAGLEAAIGLPIASTTARRTGGASSLTPAKRARRNKQ